VVGVTAAARISNASVHCNGSAGAATPGDRRRARASFGHSVLMADGRGSAGGSRAITHAQRLSSRDGYFAPESVIRRLGNTPLVPFLGGGPAVLLQVAHPLVATGVFDHSDVRQDLWRRLVHTLRALYLIAFGTKEEAERAAELVQAVHARVQGSTRTQLGRFPPGTRYSASDPELMLWVHATLVQTSLAAYERFVDPLSREDEERYYQEMAVVARLFGTPASVIPHTLADFREYFAAQIGGETLAVTAPAKEVAAVILEAHLPLPMRVFVPAHRLATAGPLPPRLRDNYGLRWSAFHELALEVAARSVRITTAPVLAVASRLTPPTGRLAA